MWFKGRISITAPTVPTPTMISSALLFLCISLASATNDGYLGSTACPNGHSDCANLEGSTHYCASYQETRECWPCIFCDFFSDSVDGSCAVCSETNTDPDDNGEAGGEADLDTTAAPTTSEPTTSEPTPAPSAGPTPAPTTPPQSCARNCGTVERGGGTCSPTNSSFCTSCNDGNLLTTDLGSKVGEHIHGNCISRITCDRRAIVSGRFDGERCTPCLDRHCFKCQISHPENEPAPSEQCFRCRDGRYLQDDGTCAETCPAGKTFVGANLFGRRCMEPFTCRSGIVLNFTDSRGCKCPNADNTRMDSNCHTCEFRAGEFGQRCTKCRNRQFLYNDTCNTDCSAFPETIEYIHGNYGSRCRAPFTCTNGVDEQGAPCKCKFVSPDCNTCRFDFAGNGGHQCLDA